MTVTDRLAADKGRQGLAPIVVKAPNGVSDTEDSLRGEQGATERAGSEGTRSQGQNRSSLPFISLPLRIQDGSKQAYI